MGIIMRNNVAYSGSGGSETVELSMAEYEAREAAGAIDSDTWYLIYDATDSYNAKKVVYDNAESGMTARTVQGAIDELNSNLESFQNGVDSIVQACTNNGSTPEENTPNAIITSINAIGNSSVKFLSSPVVKSSLSFNDSIRTISYTATADDAGYYLSYGYATNSVESSTTGTAIFNLGRVFVAKLEAGQSISITGRYGSAYSFIYKIA